MFVLHPFIEATFSSHERRIWELISRRTRENPITVKEIAERVGIDERTVRRIVSGLVNDRNLPIGSSNRPPYGYYILVDEDDYEWEYRKLRAEAMACLRRMARVRRMHISKVLQDLWESIYAEENY